MKKSARRKAHSIVDAIDQSIAPARQVKNRRHLAIATATYFNLLNSEAAAEEKSMARSLASAANDVYSDQEC
jgi:hypothetical protein